MNIGPIRLENPTILAPLAGITNLPFRLIAKEAGCGMVCSEMISANGLVHRSRKTLRMLDSLPEEKPLSVQIFGSDPDVMAEAAAMAASSGADILDINFGCSVRKVVKTGAGVALMRDSKRTEAVLTAVRRVVSIPITIKVRSGWEPSGQEAVRICKIAEQCGVDAVAVHPRTARQGFRGRADWGGHPNGQTECRHPGGG
ncbi:tRNA-dihydrouridine synthase DusB [Olavius algarvensis associated proteobacterium Delta 3]|nr:tRNA-dihydrouridine synthase DusB [Olavius algarvensis associated proteobacterium Delta 3]